jgi:hypothetical protein
MALYKQEYGFYPPVNRAAFATPLANKLNSPAFAAALSGRNINGAALPADATRPALFGNQKRLSFYSFSDSDLNPAKTKLVDAFGNTDIVVIYDRNVDGIITTGDLDAGSSAPTVEGDGSGNTTNLTPDTGMTATGGPRAAVIFYSAGKGESASDIVYSWK